MVGRAKTAIDPPGAHFGVGTGALDLRKDSPDYLKGANFYRRRALAAEQVGAGGMGSRWFIGARSAFMVGYSDGVVTMLRTPEDIAADGIDGVLVVLPLAGRIRAKRYGREETITPGELFVADTTHPREAVNAFVTAATVFIPRERFTAAVTAPVEPLTLKRLSTSPLAPAVAQQIAMLHQSLGVLSPDEFEALLDAVIEVALVMLRKLAAEEPGATDALLTAAKALIEAEFRNVDLTPADIARGLGCSRAVLYRSFAGAGLTVVGHLREVRFRHFLEGLRAGADVPLSRLAYDCGFAASPTDFTKLFKSAYGVTPSEARARLSR
ncbi:MAG: helix-turn-helix domain-containing protein [Phenylobacterium sp.]